MYKVYFLLLKEKSRYYKQQKSRTGMKITVAVLLILSAIPLAAFAAPSTNAPGYAEYAIGIEYYRAEKFLLSIGAFRKAIQSGMNDPEVYFYLGNAYMVNEDFDKSLSSFQTAFESSLKTDFQAVVLYNMGYVYYLKKDYTNSIKYFNNAYELNGALNQTFWYKGMAYYQLHNRNSVINEWENYLTAAPNGEQSDNIRAALALLRSDTFRFPSASGTNTGGTNGNNAVNVNGIIVTSGTNGNGALIDITGVLQNVSPDDRGAAENLEIEDIDM